MDTSPGTARITDGIQSMDPGTQGVRPCVAWIDQRVSEWVDGKPRVLLLKYQVTRLTLIVEGSDKNYYLHQRFKCTLLHVHCIIPDYNEYHFCRIVLIC